MQAYYPECAAVWLTKSLRRCTSIYGNFYLLEILLRLVLPFLLKGFLFYEVFFFMCMPRFRLLFIVKVTGVALSNKITILFLIYRTLSLSEIKKNNEYIKYQLCNKNDWLIFIAFLACKY